MKLKKLPVILILFLSLTPAFSAEKTRIAVMDLKADGVPLRTSRTVSNMLRTSLINTGKFLVIERSQMDSILKEQGFQQTGCTDQSCAVQLGRLMSANKILVGEVSMLGTAIITTIRIVDVEKGLSEYAAQEKADSEAVLDGAVSVLTKKLVASIENVSYVPTTTAPGAPSSVTASDAQFSDKVQITWIKSGGVKKYSIFRSVAQEDGYSKIGTSAEAMYDDADAVPGKYYYYKIQAANDSGTSDFSAADKGNINISVPAGVAASSNDSDYIKVKWSKVAGADKYYVYRSDSESGSYKEIGSTDSLGYKDSDVSAGKIFWYKVKATAATNTTDMSQAASGVKEIYVISAAGYYTRAAVPGWAQFYTKRPVMGWVMAGSFAVTAALTVFTTIEYNKAKKDYDDMPAGLPRSDYDSKYKDYEDSAAYCNYTRIALAVFYVANWVDVVLNRPKAYGQLNAMTNDYSRSLFSFNVESIDRQGFHDEFFTVSTGFRF